MKRFLLLISAMLVMSGMIAQDIYYSGYYTNSGQKYAAVYKNNTKLYEKVIGSGDCESRSVAVDPATNDVYWVRNSETYGDIFKNDAIFLNNNTGTHINSIFWSTVSPSIDLYSAGYKTGSDGVRYATIWKGSDTTPYLQPNNGNGKVSEAYDIIRVEPSHNTYYSYYCGYANATTSGSPRATVWKGEDVEYTLSSVDSYAVSIAWYDGHVYTAGYEYSGSNRVVKVWKDNTVLYTLTDASANANVFKIAIDCGDIYVVGWGTLRAQYLWKNGQMISDMGTGGDCYGLDINSTGCYVSRSNGGVCSIYKNGSVLYSSISDCEKIYDLVVTEKPADNSVRSLPFNENFEIGQTDWTSWTKIDGDGAYSTALAYWHRAGKQDCTQYSGDYCARHRGDGNSQTGWLISPRLFLQPGRDYTTLSFVSWAGSNTAKSVWISTNSDPTAISNYTNVWENNASQSWETVDINLADYQGQLIYIGFKYESSSSSNATWLIDNISVTETWDYPGVADVPYTEDFTSASEPGWIWYIFDADMTGDNRCWYNDNGKACHPWGQNNGICQTGWMFSPAINLPAGHSYHITFDSQNSSSGPQMSSALWLAVNDLDIPDPSNYTTLLWEETTTQDEHTVNIDLSAYAGQTIRLCFCYSGVYAHEWFVDNVSITSNDDINEVDANALAVYPNPTSESIRINGLDKETEVSIYNVMGVLVKTVITNGQDEINVYDFPAGLYIARFGDTTLRFTKE